MTQALKQMRAEEEEEEEEDKSRGYDYCCTEGSKSEDKKLGGESKYERIQKEGYKKKKGK